MKSVNEAVGETRWRDSMRLRLPPGVMERVEGRGTEGLGGLGKFILALALRSEYIPGQHQPLHDLWRDQG